MYNFQNSKNSEVYYTKSKSNHNMALSKDRSLCFFSSGEINAIERQMKSEKINIKINNEKAK
jgi:hypothetical protein